jgi:hypothetical protein
VADEGAGDRAQHRPVLLAAIARHAENQPIRWILAPGVVVVRVAQDACVHLALGCVERVVLRRSPRRPAPQLLFLFALEACGLLARGLVDAGSLRSHLCVGLGLRKQAPPPQLRQSIKGGRAWELRRADAEFVELPTQGGAQPVKLLAAWRRVGRRQPAQLVQLVMLREGKRLARHPPSLPHRGVERPPGTAFPGRGNAFPGPSRRASQPCAPPGSGAGPA